MNNFQKLMEEEEQNLGIQGQNNIHSNVWGTLGIFRFIGEIVDVYLPKVFDLLVVAAGGTVGDNQSRNESDAPSLAKSKDPEGPSKPEHGNGFRVKDQNPPTEK